jgi:hypothetical protein
MNLNFLPSSPPNSKPEPPALPGRLTKASFDRPEPAPPVRAERKPDSPASFLVLMVPAGALVFVMIYSGQAVAHGPTGVAMIVGTILLVLAMAGGIGTAAYFLGGRSGKVAKIAFSAVCLIPILPRLAWSGPSQASASPTSPTQLFEDLADNLRTLRRSQAPEMPEIVATEPEASAPAPVAPAPLPRELIRLEHEWNVASASFVAAGGLNPSTFRNASAIDRRLDMIARLRRLNETILGALPAGDQGSSLTLEREYRETRDDGLRTGETMLTYLRDRWGEWSAVPGKGLRFREPHHGRRFAEISGRIATLARRETELFAKLEKARREGR